MAATVLGKDTDDEDTTGMIARGRAEAPMGRVVVETTPLVVTGHTNWKVVITRTFCDMETMSSWVVSSPGGRHQGEVRPARRKQESR